MGLSNSDKNTLKAASSNGIINQLIGVKSHILENRWLDNNNVYRLDPVNRTDEENQESLQLADYIAVSSPTHLWDGWNYLGLALYSCICGYVANAKHLAYYAELRAAMSLLASQGIGIFRHKHYVVDESSAVHKLNAGGTHRATWLCLEQWANGDGSKCLLDRVLKVRSRSFSDWLEAFPCVGAQAPLGTERLLLLGFDLQRMMEDRDARNEASYRPTGIVASHVVDPRTDAEFVVETIRLLEPAGSPGSFETIDRFIFRRIIERAFETTIEGGTPEKFQKAVASMVAGFADSPIWQENIKQFLTRGSNSEEPRLLKEAENQGDHYGENYHLQVISRAMLLLRVATGIVREVLRDSDIDLNLLKFWWYNAGHMQGFWETPPESVDSSQLWSDFSPYLDDIDNWINSNNNSRQSLLTDCSGALAKVTEMARFALIGLAS